MENARLSKLLNDPSDKAKEGNKKAKQFLRGTGALRDHKGNYIISEADIYEWFQGESGAIT